MSLVRRAGSSLQRGQAMIEYAVIGATLTAAMFVISWNGRTGAQYLADAVRGFYRNLTFFLSLP